MYYIKLNNDDGTSEELEVKRESIYCKCQMCGQAFAPLRIEFDRQDGSQNEDALWSKCPECYAAFAAQAEETRRNQAYICLAEKVSRIYKKEVTPAEIEQFIEDSKGIECGAYEAAVHKRFGSAQRSDTMGSKAKIAQQGKTVIIIPRRESR